MPINPEVPPPVTTDERVADGLADLRRRVARLETGAQLITASTGAPGVDVTSKFYVDTTGPYLYVRIAGAYRRTPALI